MRDKEERGNEEWKGYKKRDGRLGEKEWIGKGKERKRYMKKGKERKGTQGEKRQGAETEEKRGNERTIKERK